MIQLIARRVKAIMLAPRAIWPAIAHEAGDTFVLLTRYVAILAAIPAVARFIGGSLIGGYRPILIGLLDALVSYALSFAAISVIALLIEALAPRFAGQRSMSNAFKLAVYSWTPVWLAGIFLIVPGLSFLAALGLYGAYLLWTGLTPMMQAPPDYALSYTVAVTAGAVVITTALGLIQIGLISGP